MPLLTRRENEIYELTVNGLSNRDIACRLNLSVNTVKVYVSKLLAKLQVESRRELIVNASLKRQHQKD